MARLAFLILIGLVSSVKGQTPKTTSRITTADGLSQGYITSLLQDSRGFIWIGTLYGLNRYDGYEIKSYTPEVATPRKLRGNGVYSITEGADGIIWFGSEKGLVALDPWSERFVHFDSHNGNLPEEGIKQVITRKNGALLLRSSDKNYVFHLSMANNRGIDRRFMPVFVMSGEKKYLYKWPEPDILELNIMPQHQAVPDMDSPGFLQQFNTRYHMDKPCSGAVLADQSGDLWIGTNGYGTRILKEEKKGVSQFASQVSFSNFACLHDDQIWPGHFNQHLVYSLETDQQEKAPWENSLPANTGMNSLHVDKNGNYWALTSNNGEYQYRKFNASTQKWSVLPIIPGLINGNRSVITSDRNGYIWFVAGNMRIIRLNPTNDAVDEWSIADLFPPKELNQFQSYSAAADNNNNLWIGTSCGLLRIDCSKEEPAFRAFHNFSSKGVLFASNHLLSVYPDRNESNIVWVGTNGGGLCKLNVLTGISHAYTTRNGLTDNVIYGILPDVTGKLWMSTNRGISCFDPSANRFFNPFSGVPALNVEFNTGAYHLMDSGKLAFGSVNGLFIIDPLQFVNNIPEISVTVSGLKINGSDFNSPGNDSFVTFTEQNEYQIDVPYSHNNISVSFIALPENSDKSVIYRYRIPTLSSEWIETGTERTINIAGIAYGNHSVEVQAAAQNGKWSETTRLYLRIRAPWYASYTAWLIYALLVFLGISQLNRRHKKQLELKHAVELSKIELDRMKTIDEFKARFYSYITHEFKTPLTILLNLSGRINPEVPPQKLTSIKTGITQQAENMLELVNQVMDVSRFHDKNPELHWRQGDIGTYVRLWVESFRPLADFKQIKLDFSTDAVGLIMDFDPIRLKYIINNLLGNAIRHTPQGGAVRVALDRCSDSRICLKVTDDGEGISPEDLPSVFERNFRGKSRNKQEGHFGLGLAFVKDLIFLFNGDIRVESQPGISTRFTVYLPITNKAPLMEAEPLSGEFSAEEPENMQQYSGKKPLLLIADDNQVILSYLQSFLSRYFQVLAAPDGQIAWELALEHLPDIVLADLVMPELDGLQLTDKIKAHELTCHIPVVMLSARAEVEDRIQGHQHGADGFVPKPFHEQELVLILQNMLLLQERWRKRFESAASTSKITTDSTARNEGSDHIHDPFMKRLYSVFESHFSEEDFDLDHLCQHMMISKSQLQRKLAAVVPESAMELLREFRLVKAQEFFLKFPELQVKEVCTKVGFKNPAHFSTLFTKRFGVSPSELRKRPEE